MSRWLVGLGVALAALASACAPAPPTNAGGTSAPNSSGSTASANAPSGAPAAPPPIVLRHAHTSLSTSHAPYWIAREAGYFAEEGLDLQAVMIQGSSTAVQSLLAGEIQTMNVSGAAPVQAAGGGADLVIVATSVNTVTTLLITVPEITTPEQLRGQPIGVTRFGTISDYLTRLAVTRWGLQPGTDVPIVQVGGQSEAVAAMQSGAVRGVMSADAQAEALRELGYHLLFDCADLGLEYAGHTVTTTRQFAEQNPEALRRFIRALGRGMARFVKDKDYSVQVLHQYTGLDSLDALGRSWAAHAGRYANRDLLTTPEAIRSVLTELATDERLRDAAPERFYDNRFVQEQHDNGFLARVYAE